MIIKILLTLLCSILLFYSLRSTSKHRFSKSVITLIIVIGYFAIWNPNSTTYIANLMGVGRGTDLLLYILIITNLYTLSKIKLKFEEQDEKLTILSRKVAIIQVDENKPDKICKKNLE